MVAAEHHNQWTSPVPPDPIEDFAEHGLDGLSLMMVSGVDHAEVGEVSSSPRTVRLDRLRELTYPGRTVHRSRTEAHAAVGREADDYRVGVRRRLARLSREERMRGRWTHRSAGRTREARRLPDAARVCRSER